MIAEDTLIGPATLSELRKTIAICTQTHQTNLQIVPTGCFTDGSTIFVCSPPAELGLVERWILLEASTIHESWHILFGSDFQLLREFVKKYENKYQKKIQFIGQISHDIVNIVEDGRIEYLGKRRFLGTKNSILFNNAYWLRKRPTFKGMKDWQMFIEALLQLGVCGGLKEEIPIESVKIVVRAANFYLHWAKIQESSEASFLAAEKVITLLLEHFQIEGGYSKQVITPPMSVVFKQKDDSSELRPEEVPDLPEEMQDQLNEVRKEQEAKQKEKQDKDGTSEGEGASESVENNEEDSATEMNSTDVDDEEREEGEYLSDERDNKEGMEREQGKRKKKNQDLEQERTECGGTSADGEDASEGNDLENQSANDAISSEGKSERDFGKNGMESQGKDQAESDGDLSDSGENDGRQEIDNFDVGDNSITGGSQDSYQEGEQSGVEVLAGDGKGESIGSTLEGNDIQINDQDENELIIVSIDEIDPIKSGLINPAAIKIKIEDLVKRNYTLLRDRDLQQQAEEIVRKLSERKVYKDVFCTKTFDIGIEIELQTSKKVEDRFISIFNSLRSLIQVTINQFKALFKSGSKTTSRLKFGRLDSQKMVRGMINEDPHIFKKNLVEKGKNEIAIVLLIDQSGSMHGEKILNAQKAAILFGEVLHSLDINFAIYGWTDISYNDARFHPYLHRVTDQLPKWTNVPFPPTINQEVYTAFCYKEFGENYLDCRSKLGLITAISDNSDHNAIEFVTQKLLRTKRRVKILMVLSDGQPAALSYDFIGARLRGSSSVPISHYASYGRGNLGLNVTRQAVEYAQKLGIQTLCISIDAAKNYQEQIYGANNFIVVDPRRIQELPVKVAKLLSLILRRAGVKF